MTTKLFEVFTVLYCVFALVAVMVLSVMRKGSGPVDMNSRAQWLCSTASVMYFLIMIVVFAKDGAVDSFGELMRFQVAAFFPLVVSMIVVTDVPTNLAFMLLMRCSWRLA